MISCQCNIIEYSIISFGALEERWVDIIGNPRQRKAALERILDVANYVRDEDGKVFKDGAAVPAPGAGDALILYISCQEADLTI